MLAAASYAATEYVVPDTYEERLVDQGRPVLIHERDHVGGEIRPRGGPVRVGRAVDAQSPSRSSIVSLRRHLGDALTLSSRKTLRPRSCSMPGRAHVPISRTIAPPLPIRICFCDSVSV